MGQKLKKDAVKIKEALPKLTSEQVKEFVQNEEIIINEIKIVKEDLQVIRYFENANSHYETKSDKDVLILLDIQIYQDLQEEGCAREIVNRVQRLRKKVKQNKKVKICNINYTYKFYYFIKFIGRITTH